MATDVGTLVVNLQANLDELKKGLAEGKSQVEGFGKGFEAMGRKVTMAVAGFSAAVIAGAAVSLKSWGDQEQAIVRLNNALANQGIESDKVTMGLIRQASALQELTGVADETITSSQALLVSFGLTGEALNRATKAALDFSVATGTDLSTAAMLIGKAFKGETGTLSRYGIIVDENIDKTKKFDAALSQLEGRFGGQAEAQRKTVIGQFAALKNTVSDVFEEIGRILSGPFGGFMEAFISGLREIADLLGKFATFGGIAKVLGLEILQQLFNTLMGAIMPFVALWNQFVVSLGPVATNLGLVQVNMQGVTNAVNGKIQAIQNEIMTEQQSLVETQQTELLKQKSHQTTAQVFEDTENFKRSVNKNAQNTMLSDYAAGIKSRMEAEEKFKDQFLMTQASIATAFLGVIDSITSKFGDEFANMVLEAKSFSDAVKSIWKDLVREVVRLIGEMIAKWLVFSALTGGGGGFIGRAFGKGFASGGIIGEPSVLTGLQSGVSRMVGEAGPEAVVPIGKSVTAQEAGVDFGKGGGGGMNLTINVNGTFIEGSESKWQAFIRDVIVPHVNRFAQSVPSGPFNRQRGVLA